MKILKGQSKGRGKRIAIVASLFNESITQRLVDGCVDELRRAGVPKNNVTLAYVPGSYEIPVTALKFAKNKNIHAVVCLGAVIRGETSHFDLVARGVAQGILEVSLLTGKPIIFGVLTTDTMDQATKRSQEKGDNKGCDAATVALEMVDLFSKI